MADAPAPNDKDLIAALKTALGADGDGADAPIAALVSRHADAALPLLKRAARGSAKREEALALRLLARGDAGCPVADAAIRARLEDPRHPARDAAVQVIAFEPARLRFAPQLRAIAADRDDPAWAFAVRTLGALRDRGAVDVLMDQTAGLATPFPVLAALVPLHCPEAALAFEPNLAHPEARTRTYALWGLAALDYPAPVGGLVDLLDDPDRRDARGSTPGQSMRAAQALADVFDWPFEWGDPAAVEAVRARCRERFSPAHLEACRTALAAGRLAPSPEPDP